MNGYQPSTPRTALAFAAVAMATVTLGAMIVLPAKFDSLSADPYVLAADKATGKAPPAVAAGADPAPRAIAAEAVPSADAVNTRPIAVGAAQINTEGAASEATAHAGRTILDTQAFDGKRRKVSLRSRTST